MAVCFFIFASKQQDMETKVNFNVLETIEKIYLHSKDSHLRPPLFEVLKEDLQKFSDYLHVDELTALIFANAFTIWYKEDSFNEVFNHFGMNEFLEVLKHREQIELLYKRNLLKNKRSRYGQINTFDIPQSIINRVSKGEPIPLLTDEEEREKGFVDVLQDFDRLSNQFDDEEISFYEFREEMNNLIDDHLHFPFFEKMKTWKLDDFETYFLLYTIWDAVEKGSNNFMTDICRTVRDYHKEKSIAMELVNAVINGETRLTMLKLIEIQKAKYRNHSNAKLSKNVVKLLKETQKLELEFTEDENTKLLQYKNIKGKTLFYNEAEISQMEILKNALTETKFRAMQKKMAEKAMPLGITILLHGEPGTGKTESVYQLAKESGRNIFKVDISQTKTMWFGESEKLVKRIFTDYAELKNEEKRCPILLFNEADAIIGKRKSAGSSNVADTENAIQNIILEEMENFDGILMATTNLVENMDAAFERRFLFKVKFEKPAVENSAKIWKSKLRFLTENESLELAEIFHFSGGEMENIARKCTMHEILNGEVADFELVKRFCGEEKWSGKGEKKIGF